MTSGSELYEFGLASSGKLKLRATARLAEGGPDATFEACVLLHEAARLERRAAEVLPACPASTRLAASVEECFCLVEGRNPPGAGEVWGRILREKRDVDGGTAEALLSRLTPRYEASRRGFAKLIGSCTTLRQLRIAGALVPTSAAERARAAREVNLVLSKFPGIPGFWWAAYRLAEAGGDLETAWSALSRAHRLEPDNRQFTAMGVLVAARALSAGDADEHLGRARASLDRAGAEVCLMYALAEIELARADGARARWLRAREATGIGLVQARSEELRRELHATQLVLDSLLAGQDPTFDALYLAGLGAVAASAPPKSNVIELLSSEAERRVQAMERRAAA
ncbi:hypothetical protein [Sorangium sp. So ce131]|uniref:hypothetical protein n=1 Tax=Sorangium sp. So ce131 TaxID=3133282 RepID=UPI003F5D6CA9